MIVEIPTEKDFFEAAENLLNSAWGQVCELLVDFNDSDYDADNGQIDDERYWKAAKQTLVISYSTVQQAVEFFIKGRIASVSPFLLLSGGPSNWPKGSNKVNQSFANFRTVDAQDLIRLHDTVFCERFSDEFQQWYNDMRNARNRIMHTVDRSMDISPKNLVDAVLKAHDVFASEKWVSSRLKYLDRAPQNSMNQVREKNGHEPYILFRTYCELTEVIHLLDPSKVKTYFNFDKKQRSCQCPKCHIKLEEMEFFESGKDDEHLIDSYQNTEGRYKCFVCSYEGNTLERNCIEDDCDSNQIDEKYEICLVCFHGQ
jgi:hypothetical protein